MKYVELWCNNDNNDNTHAGAKFDAGGGAETSFPLTVALSTVRYVFMNFSRDRKLFHNFSGSTGVIGQADSEYDIVNNIW